MYGQDGTMNQTIEIIKMQSLKGNVYCNCCDTFVKARAVFERAYHNVTLHKLEYIDSKPLMSQLSPELLQKFSVRDHSYDPDHVPSKLTIPTAVQVSVITC